MPSDMFPSRGRQPGTPVKGSDLPCGNCRVDSHLAHQCRAVAHPFEWFQPALVLRQKARESALNAIQCTSSDQNGASASCEEDVHYKSSK